MSKDKKRTELPKELVVTEAYEIGENIGDGKTNAVRILLEPPKCYLRDELVQLEGIVKELVRRYNQLVPKWELWQILHKIHQKRFEGGDKYEMITQNQFDRNGGGEEKRRFQEWMDDTREKHPLPPSGSMVYLQ